MKFDREWLGPEFFELAGLNADFDAQGELQRMGLITPQRRVEVTLKPAQAVTVEPADEELTLEEWLDGWRHNLVQEARPKVFQPTCSFCGKTDSEVRKIIAGPSVMICNECVELCSEILSQD